MYIRWKTKPRAREYELKPGEKWRTKTKPVTLYIAYLVESKRIDGKPRQKTTYLACIQDKHIDSPGHRFDFWKTVEKNIAPLNPTAELIAMVQTKLQERVPIPTKEQREEEKRGRDEAVAALMASIKARGGL